MINKRFLIIAVILLIFGIMVYVFRGQPDNNADTSLSSATTAGADETVSNEVPSRYINYTEDGYDLYKDKKRVLFFHAKWCPTCKVADTELNANLDKIPEDVVILKTDYDTEAALKKKYNITYQHTFVLVDGEGNEIKQWNGGGIAEIIDNTKI